jgi:alcohol dehydrogenase (cytochrome c)/quinohemoprotein ethanol dehydrogenase
MAFPYIAEEGFMPTENKVNLGADLYAAAMPQDPETKAAIKAATKGRLVAWDPVQQREVWGIDQPVPWNGGTLSTAAGLVFQGDGKGHFKAFDAVNGDEVWSWFAQTGIIAPPITYRVGGTQYVAVMAGWGGAVPLVVGELVSEALSTQKNRLMVFSLSGEKQLPKLKQIERELNPPARVVDAELIEHGKLKYQRYCSSCHGDSAVSGGVLPDLRYMSQQTFEYFNAIVLYGMKKDQGMVGFENVLSKKDSSAIKAYVIERAHEAKSEQIKQEAAQ